VEVVVVVVGGHAQEGGIRQVIVEEEVVRMAGFSILEVVAIPVTLITTEEDLLHQENSSPKRLEVKEMVQLCMMR
jgi:hypothetical protein